MKMLVRVTCLFIVPCVLSMGLSQIAFEEKEENPDRVNKDNRKPLYVPGRCENNELLYPGDQADDWVCDCAAGYVFYPKKMGCYRAYRQGPCADGEYLILPKDKSIPECVKNPCKKDKMVEYKGMCHQLSKTGGPCGPINRGGGVLGVNASTLEIECLQSIEQLTIFKIPPKQICPPGSKRDQRGDCREIEK